MARAGNPGAFEAVVDRYQGRLLGFCRQMLGSTEDAEDVLQEVFVNAYRAMLADEREINLRPWLYRIARNRCLNHLRKPTADAQESMDMVPMVEAATTAEKVHNREEFRQLLTDVGKLPETQRSALLLREMDAMSYEEIAQAMETSVPSVKSLLVRARISLAEASQARQLTCGEVRIDLAEAAEGLRKLSGPVRRHVRDCEECADFRSQLRSNDKVLAALVPVAPLVALKGFFASKLGLGGSGASGASTAATGAGATATGAGAAGGLGAALGGGGAAGGLGGIGGAVGGAIGTKAVAGALTAAVLTAGAVGVEQQAGQSPVATPSSITRSYEGPPALASAEPAHHAVAVAPAEAQVAVTEAPAPPVDPEPVATEEPATTPATDDEAGTEESTGNGGSEAPASTETTLDGATPSGTTAGAPAGAGAVVVTVGGSTGSTTGSESAPPAAPPTETAPPPTPPAESQPPAEEVPPASPASSETPAAEG